MGLIELAIATLCLNATCVEEENKEYFKIALNAKRDFLNQLAEDLRHENLFVTTLKNDRLSGYTKRRNVTRGSGVAFDLLNILQKKFHFNYTILAPKDNVWAKSKNGAFEMLKKGKVNITAAFLPVLTEYSTEIHYSPSLDTGEWVVLMKRPEASATGSGLLAPFTLPVWSLILLSLVVVGPVIYFIIYLQNKLCKEDENKVFPLPACIWFVYGALLKQGTTLNPMTDSSRLLFSTWWIFITILTAFYTANLTAFLTLSKFTLPINEGKDIGAKKYKWVTTAGNALQDTVTTKDSSVTDLQKTLGRPHSYLELKDSEILKIFVGKYNMMFIREKPIVEYVMYDDYKAKTKNQEEEPKRCTYVITKFSVVTYSRAFAYSKHFKYKPLFDSAIQYLVESGIIKFKLREDLPDTAICPLNLGNKERQLRNSDLKMTYEIVGGGFILSAIVFLMEFIIRRSKKAELDGGPTHTKKNLLFVPTQQKHSFEVNLNDNYKNYPTPPPSYYTLFSKGADIKRKQINGRNYWVYGNTETGGTKMIPMRTPSALLFQYTQ